MKRRILAYVSYFETLMNTLTEKEPKDSFVVGVIVPSVGAFYRIISALEMRVEVAKPID